MCVVSAIIDDRTNLWKQHIPQAPPQWTLNELTQEEIAALREFLKEDLPELKRLIEEGRRIDEENNEPDCEMEEKKKFIRELAEKLEIEIDIL